MTGAFVLTLDTTAPRVTFGAVGGATAGELLEVLYTINEPELVDAEIKLADNRVLPMEVLSDRLLVLLPPDTPDGNARITVHTLDDLLNAGTQTQRVHLSGTIVIPPDEPVFGDGTGAPPQRVTPRREDPLHQHRDHAVVRITTRSRIRARVHNGAVIVIAPRPMRILRLPIRSTSVLNAMTSSRTRVQARSRSRVTIVETAAIERHWPPPDDETMIALGLL